MGSRFARRGIWIVLLALAAGAVATIAVLASHRDTAARAAPSQTRPATRRSAICGSRRTPARVRSVVLIVMENHSTADLIGPPGSAVARKLPYLNTLVRRCGWASNYHAITHPSLPNYIAMTSGATRGITTDCVHCSTPAHNIFRLLARRGMSWRAYEEGMRRPCQGADGGLYVKRHNPPAYFTNLRRSCRRFDLPMGNRRRGPLHRALAHGMPSLAFVTPNVCNDMHSCGSIFGDAWLKRWIPRLTASRGYRRGSTVVFLTWDEGKGGSQRERCAASSDRSCMVPLVVLSRSVRPGTVARRAYTHYSLLESVQRLLGVRPLLGAAGSPQTRSLLRAFNLG